MLSITKSFQFLPVVWLMLLLAVNGTLAAEDCDGEEYVSLRQGNTCLYVQKFSRTRPEAQQWCESNQAKLAEPKSNKTMQDQYLPLMSSVNSNAAHVGVDQTSNAGGMADFWQLATGGPLASDIQWEFGQPDDSGVGVESGVEDCAAVKNTGGLNGLQDIDCSLQAKQTTICEYGVNGISVQETIVNDPPRETCLKLEGQFLGSSCFFKTGLTYTWTDCWTQLTQYHPEARPARIYTNEIMTKLKVLLGVGGEDYWTSLKNTMWYDDETTPDSDNLPSVRPVVNGQSATASLCGVARGELSGSPAFYADQCNQLFKCVGEIGQMKTNIVPAGDVRACALECQQTEGCLSFTYELANGNCTQYAAKSDGIPSHFTTFSQSGVDFYERIY